MPYDLGGLHSIPPPAGVADLGRTKQVVDSGPWWLACLIEHRGLPARTAAARWAPGLGRICPDYATAQHCPAGPGSVHITSRANSNASLVVPFADTGARFAALATAACGSSVWSRPRL